jgi:hypothetical protein
MNKLLPAALSLLTASLCACGGRIDITVLSDNVPGMRADVERGDDGSYDKLNLSSSVAVALECEELAEFYAGPCRDLEVTVDDDAIVQIKAASLLPQALLSATDDPPAPAAPPAESAEPPPERSVVVLVGGTPGASTLHIAAQSAQRDLEIEVPAPAEP